ncbi:MAG: hypothetical protein II404_02000 [Prevotella sp.]|nr:hypothetical protein [Prevotella sp.]
MWQTGTGVASILYYADDRGIIRNLNLSDDSPYGIKVRRFAAAMKACGKEECLYVGIEHLISDACSEEKMKELCLLLKQNLQDKFSMVLAKPDILKGKRERKALFEALFRYRKNLYKVENTWSGVMECSQTVAIGIKATNNLYQKHIKAASDVLDKMLVLLMGDDYDKSFTETELLPYGYPDVTDRELEDMILDNW